MEHRRSQPAAVVCILLAALLPAPAGERIADKPFLQEVHEGHPLGVDPGANDARAVTLDSTGSVWVATRAGLYRLAPGETGWSRPTSAQEATSPADRNGPAFDLSSDADGVVWAGAWNGVWRGKGSRVEKLPGIEAPVAAICAAGKVVFAAGPDGLWEIAADRVTSKPLPCSRNVRAILPSADGGLWLATAMGLHLERPGGALKLQTGDSGFSTDVRGIAFARDGFLWSAGLGGIVVYNAGRFQAQPTPAVGLPSSDARCVAPGLDGRMWVGTAIGLACFDGRTWSLRHSKRWLVDDDVRDVAFGPDGTGWVATAGGVSALRQRRLTLAEKAEHYHRICAARHVREPGLVEKCRLRVPGDVSTWEPQDDDNDGQYTSMYLAMESFRFAVTKDPEARAAARRAFHALKFLQEVTGTRGFVARTVIPSTWTRMFDPNEAIGAAEWAERRVRDAREKRVELHWRPSKDGKWLWKGDTSSDEITGHMYGYLVYYDLAADGDERKLVSEQVDRVVGTIVDDGFALKDIDGAPTRWGMWAPEKLNGDPDWAPERGVNSVEILSYLKLAKHVTGDPKYEEHYRRLLRDHRYDLNVQRAKTLNPSWRTHIDDELLALAYPALCLHETDPELRTLYRQSLASWHAAVREEHSPYFDFTYAGLAGGDLSLDGAVEFLRDAPLDLVRWTIDNSRREDLRLVRAPELEHLQTSRLPPASERGVMRWDDNPWIAVQGDGGQTESDGVYWLLPYWMGRYHGLVGPPE